MTHQEQQYINLLRDTVDYGSKRIDRTKVGTRAIFGTQLRFDLSGGMIPIMTTKKVLWSAALKELLWFLTGETNIRPLLQSGVTIWTDWPLKKYRTDTGDDIGQKDFEKRILDDEEFALKWGDLGPVYGKQWRRWKDYEGGEIDQVARAVDLIKNDPYSRRIIIEGWNVAELSQMALTPCHKTYQFFVKQNSQGEDELSLLMSQRSTDLFLGCPFNLCSSGFFLHMMAHQCDMKVGDFVWQSADTHVYENHIDAVRTQIARTPKVPPLLEFTRRPEDIFSYKFEDFKVIGYGHHPFIKGDVAV